MSISVTCPECGKTYDLPDGRAGQSGSCSCGAAIAVPGGATAAAAPVLTRKPSGLLNCPACNTVLPPRTDICPRCGTNRLAPPPPAPAQAPMPAPQGPMPPSPYPPPAPGYEPPTYVDPAIAAVRLMAKLPTGRPVALSVVLILSAIGAVIGLAVTVVAIIATSSIGSPWTFFVLCIEVGYLSVLWFVWEGQGWARRVLLAIAVLAMLYFMVPAFLGEGFVAWLVFLATVAVVVILVSPSTYEWCSD